MPAIKTRVVVVDDDRDTRAFMRVALSGAGYDVRVASEGTEALGLLRERPADLLIADIFMPGQTGFQTVSRCKAEFPQTRIIVMSAGTLPGLDHDFLSPAAHLGVGATLRKPFNAEQLLDALRKVLQDPAS